MPRTPKWDEPAITLSARVRPDSAKKIDSIVYVTRRNKSEITDEIIALGLPLWLKRNPLPKEATA